jgi:hypothetical protein
MFQGAFKKLEFEQIAILLDHINPLLDGSGFDAVETTIMALDLDFYSGYSFLDITETGSLPIKRRFAVCKSAHSKVPTDFTILNWTNEPIYKMNEEIPIQLNEANVLEYVRFFFGYVRGKHGRFIITENVDDIHWKEDPPPQARKAISKMLIPLAAPNIQNGSYILKTTMMFRDSLFQADLEVKPSGLVILSNEQLLVEDMPVLDDVFGQ